MNDTNDAQQTIGFDDELAIYHESGWVQRPVRLIREGDSSFPLVVNVKFTNSLGDNAPAAQNPVYHDAVEVHFKAGETGLKEVPVRIKIGSVQTEPLALIARLQIPLGQNVTLLQGRGWLPVKIVNVFTTDAPDKSAEYVVQRGGLVGRPIQNEIAEYPSQPVESPLLTAFIPPSE